MGSNSSQHIRERNGTLFACIPDDDNGSFVSYILTSAQLFNRKFELFDYAGVEVSPVHKIDVRLQTNKLYEGKVMACDMEMRIAVVKIKSDDPLPTATLAPFSDSISLGPVAVSESDAPLCQSPYPTKLFPGDEVTIVGCSFGESCIRHTFFGIHCVDYIGSGFDSKPFLKIHCRRRRVVDGAPVINCEGDVIGVSFALGAHVAFLPVNVFFKWWKQVVTYREIRRPWMGIQIANLYTAGISDLEYLVLDYDVSGGVLVEKVMPESPAKFAKMHSKDVIYQCDGMPVRSLLEFTELLWDKSGEVIEVKGVRKQRHFVCKVEIKAIKTEILPETIAECIVTKDMEAGIRPETLEATNTGGLPVSLEKNVVTRKKSTKKGNNKANDKKKSKKNTSKRKRKCLN